MIRHLTLKPDFARTVDRFHAWWRCELVDRPPVTLYVRPSRPAKPIPTRQHATLRESWFDVEYKIEQAIAHFEQADWVGDAFPVFYPNLGPELTATLLGCELEFSPSTSWSVPILDDVSQWRGVIGKPLDWSNPYWRAVEAGTRLALERSEGRYIVGIADLHDNYDTMAALRDPQALLTDLMDDRELVMSAGRDLVRVFQETFSRLYNHVHAAGMGSTTWTSVYHEGPAYLPNCDLWCMLGPDVARDLILPDIISEMSVLERSLFHLDGPQALRHLDLLLQLPELNGVQWVYGDGNGPAARWIDVYRRIVAAGKCVQVVARDPRDALTVLEAVGPRGLWLCVGGHFDSVAEADAYLRDVERLTTSAAAGPG